MDVHATRAWRAGQYHLLALDTLEDVAGNQIGRAFEVDNFDTVDKSPNPQSITIPFTGTSGGRHSRFTTPMQTKSWRVENVRVAGTNSGAMSRVHFAGRA